MSRLLASLRSAITATCTHVAIHDVSSCARKPFKNAPPLNLYIYGHGMQLCQENVQLSGK